MECGIPSHATETLSLLQRGYEVYHQFTHLLVSVASKINKVSQTNSDLVDLFEMEPLLLLLWMILRVILNDVEIGVL